MPPKKTKKAPLPKVQPPPSPVSEPTTPDASDGAASDVEVPKKAKPTRTRKKPAITPTVYYPLPSELGDSGPVTVMHDAETHLSVLDTTTGEYKMQLRFHAMHPFSYVTSVMLDSGPFVGHMAAIVRPAKPFPFMELPPDVRHIIFRLVLAPGGVLTGKISITKSQSRGFAATEYAEKMKNRLGIMYVNKLTHAETQPILYGNHLRFEDTIILLNFMSRLKEQTKRFISSIEIDSYKKTCTATALDQIAECHNLRKIHIATGVGTKSSPSKAAKAFYSDAQFFIKSMASISGDPLHAYNLLRFGRSDKCFSIKDGDDVRAWTQEEKVEFDEHLRRLMNFYDVPAIRFNCICGSNKAYHTCIKEINANTTEDPLSDGSEGDESD